MKFALIPCFLAGLLLATTSRAPADEWNQATVFTFRVPVEIPGQVLAPGSYVFKVANWTSVANVVEVFNGSQTHLYGAFLAIPIYHFKTSNRAFITFDERAAGAPLAVKTWFDPGDKYGHEFIYPKHKPFEHARIGR